MQNLDILLFPSSILGYNVIYNYFFGNFSSRKNSPTSLLMPQVLAAEWSSQMKRITILAVVLVLVLTGLILGTKNSLLSSLTETSTNNKIFLVIEGKQVKDGGFNEGCWKALHHFSLQADTRSFANPKGLPLKQVLEQALQEKPGLVFITTNGGYDPAIETVAKAHPDTKFYIIDHKATGKLPNFSGIDIDIQEGSMLAGYIAGRMTKTHKLGFLGGKEGETIDRFLYGFKAGALLAARERQEPIEVVARYTNSFFDEEAGQQLAKALYAEQCDILLQAAGQSGLGAIKEAAQEGKFIIGVDVDQKEYAPGFVLTSVLKHLDTVIANIVNSYLNKEVYELEQHLGLRINATGLPLENPNVPYHILRDTRLLATKMKEEQLLAPKNQEEYAQFLESETGKATGK